MEISPHTHNHAHQNDSSFAFFEQITVVSLSSDTVTCVVNVLKMYDIIKKLKRLFLLNLFFDCPKRNKQCQWVKTVF
jgi:hypothetical protein